MTPERCKKIVYMVLDIRHSCKINEDTLSHHNDIELFKFYDTFKTLCDSIAVKKHSAIFTKQIGDRIDYVWERADFNEAIQTAIELFDEIPQKLKTPDGTRVDIGIGISTGVGIIDHQNNHVLADCPRIAAIFQEESLGIYCDAEPENLHRDYTYTKVIIPRRKDLYPAYQIVKKSQLKETMLKNKQDVLDYTRGITQDRHLHIEGIGLPNTTIRDIVTTAFSKIQGSKIKKEYFKKVTGTEVDDVEIENIKNNDSEVFSFPEFLTQLYLAKIALCESEESAFNYVKASLQYVVKKSPSFTVGIQPSIPVEFTYLNQMRWYSEVTRALHEVMNMSYLLMRPTFVIETKRQHLENDIYLHNLKLLEMMKNCCPSVQLAVGLCDDAERKPLNTKKIQAKYKDYILRAREIDPNVSVQVHELEQYWRPDPLREINFLFDFFDSEDINGVTWIHMSYLDPKRGPLSEVETVSILENLERRGDQIILCYSSNLKLGGPFAIDNPTVFKALLKDNVKMALGTDDPLPFKVSGIREEFNIVEKHLLEAGYKYDDVKMAINKLAINSKV